MNTTKCQWLFVVAASAVIFSIGSGAAQNAQPPAQNLLDNGGFEEWGSYSPWNANAPLTGYLEAADEVAPAGWNYINQTIEQDIDQNAPTIAFRQDRLSKHGGDCSVCIGQTSPMDIGSISSRQIEIASDTEYKVRVWIKADEVVKNKKDSAGICVWTKDGPERDFWSQKAQIHFPDMTEGTFDWQPMEFTFRTGSDSDRLIVSLQLRQASGKVWFDDVELMLNE